MADEVVGGAPMSKTPPIGGHAGPLECGRLLRFPDPASRCPNEATHHVIWTADCENGLTCDEHTTEARDRWDYVAIHPYEMTCSMPGAVFVHDENRCVVDEDSLGLARQHEAGEGCWCSPDVLVQPSGEPLIVHQEVTFDE